MVLLAGEITPVLGQITMVSGKFQAHRIFGLEINQIEVLDSSNSSFEPWGCQNIYYNFFKIFKDPTTNYVKMVYNVHGFIKGDVMDVNEACHSYDIYFPSRPANHAVVLGC